MAERLAYLEAVVGADITQFRKGMRDVRNEVGLFGETMEGVAAIGRTATLAFTVPMTTLGTFAVQAASDFDAAMRNINSLLFLSEEQLQSLSDEILEFGSNLRGGAIGAAEAFYIAVSAGIEDSALAFEFMRIASMTAEAGLADLQVTTEALAAGFLAFGGATMEAAEQVELLERVSDVLTATVGYGVGSMDVFATALGKIFPTAVSVGAELDSVGATLAYLTQRGLKAARAGTALESAMTALLKPSEAMKAAFASLGVQSGEELVEQFGSLEDALIAVIETADGSATALAQLFLNKEARRAIGFIADDLDQYRAAIEAFDQGIEGMTARAHEQQMMSFAAHWDLMTAALQGAAITIGNVLLPVLMPVVDGIADLLNGVVHANPQIVALAVGFAAAAAAAAPLIWLIGSLVNPLSLAITAVGALSTAFVADFGGIQSIVSDTLDSIFGDLTGFKDAVTQIFEALFPPTVAEQVQANLPTINIPAEDVIQIEVKEGDTLWGIWFADFKDQFTWEEFKAAVGWEEGHVLQPGEILTVNGTQFREGLLGLFDQVAVTGADIINRILARVTPLDQTQIVPAEFRYHFDGMEQPFEHRLLEAKQIFDQTLRPILEEMVESARAWFDEKVGEGLAWIASLFENAGGEGGNTPIYRAVSALFDLDIGRAIDEIIPGFGTDITNAVSGWGQSILDAFPTIRDNFGKLLDNIGNWLISEGLPTLARSAGRLGASLAAALFDAVASAISFLTSPATGEAAGAVAGYVSDTLLPEFQAGWEEGLAGTALQTEGIPALQSLFDSIGTTLDALNIDKIVEGLGGLGEGLADFAEDLASADWSGVQMLLGIIGYLSAGLFMLSATVVGSALDSVGDILSTLGDGIASIVDAFAIAAGGDVEGALRSLSEGLFILAMTPIQGIAGALDLLVEGIENLFQIDLNLPDFSTEITEWLEGIQAAWDADATFEQVIEVTPMGIDLVWENPEQLQVAVGELRERMPAIGEAISAYLSTHPPEAEAGALILGFRDNAVLSLDAEAIYRMRHLEGLPDEEIAFRVGMLRIVTDEGTDITVAAANAPLTATPEPGTVVTTVVSDLQVDAAGATITQTGVPDIAETVLPADSLANHFTAEAQAAAEQFAERMTQQFAEGGVADPAIVENSFLQPLETAFVEYLGDNSTIVQTLVGFIDTTIDKTTEAGASFGTLGLITGVTMTGIALTVAGIAPGVIANLGAMRGAVDMLAGAFLGLAAAAAAAVTAVNLVNGLGGFGGDFGGARADGGDVQANKTYLVGERGVELFTPTRSGSIISHEALFGAMGSGGGGDTIYQTVNIYEANNLDAILYEAERRGMRLGQR